MSPATFAIGLIVLVALAALLARAFSGDREAGPAGGSAEPPDEALDAPDAAPLGELVAVTSDGDAFLPRGHGIVLVPVGRRGDADGLTPRELQKLATDVMTPGELIAARVRRGAPDHDPWRLEALGRDGEYRAWRFETEEAARAALVLVDGRVVRAPHDENGDPVMVGDDEFDRARRIEEETERELAMEGEGFGEEAEPR